MASKANRYGLLVALAASAWSVEARANGRYPAAGQIAVNPSDPAHIVARTTYGLLQSTDAGKTWQWICETAASYEDATDPYLAVSGKGAILLATQQGLSVSSDRGCGFARVAGPLSDRPAIDLVVDHHDALHIVALVIEGGTDRLRLAETHDGGETWQVTGQPLPAALTGLTIELAPSDAKRIYVTAHVGMRAQQSVLVRSDDGGATWATLAQESSGGFTDYLAGVDTLDSNRVYVRRIGADAAELRVSGDGGAKWQTVFAAKDGLFGFALSPDGSQVAVSTRGTAPGIWLADAKTLTFSQHSTVGGRCLTWTAAGLYVCADEASDHFTIGLSKDAGKTVQPLHHVRDVTPLECPKGSRTANECPKVWPALRKNLGIAAPSQAVPPVATAPGGCAASGHVPLAGCLSVLAIALACLAVRRR